MGYYIQGPTFDKASYIVEKYNGKVIPVSEALENLKAGKGVICVVQNGVFDAAAFCFSEREFEAFNDPDDHRIKTWIFMDLEKAKELSGFNK